MPASDVDPNDVNLDAVRRKVPLSPATGEFGMTHWSWSENHEHPKQTAVQCLNFPIT